MKHSSLYSIPRRKKCSNPKNPQGIWDVGNNQWWSRPCTSRTCPKHWKAWAIKRLRQLYDNLDKTLYYYHIRLSCHIHELPKDFYQLKNIIKKIKAEYPACKILTAKHKTKKYVHIHLAVGLPERSNVLIAIRGWWETLYPAKTTRKYTRNCCMIKPHDDPVELIRYFLFGRIRKPRITPPYGDLGGCVIRWNERGAA